MRKLSDQYRRRLVHIRVSLAERERFMAAAALEGRGFSEWVRAACETAVAVKNGAGASR